MKKIYTIQEWRDLRSTLQHHTIGFVPTMGYLHEGHLSLIRKAKKECDFVVVSIFVNPLQFGPTEDLERYPRDEKRDTSMAESEGVDVLFIPSVEEMYPQETKTIVQVQGITDKLCGASRPGHFTGVATVVTKLFNLIQPVKAFFGQKDAQQAAVIKQFVQDLNIPVNIVICPTVREGDGIAMSSRNVYLSVDQREQAVVLYQALSHAVDHLIKGERDAKKIQTMMRERIQQASLAEIDYVEVLQYPSLEERQRLEGEVILALAVRFGPTRLIDNALVNLETKEAMMGVQANDESKNTSSNRN